MSLPAFVGFLRQLELPGVAERARPEHDQVRAIATRLGGALNDCGFVLDCIALELASLDRQSPSGQLIPFFVLPESGVRLAFGYWPPGHAAIPHEHNDWTVTAVFHNRLEVETFDFEVARTERRLQQRHRFAAQRGAAGHIYLPCIHAPRNPSADWSLSLHVLGPHDEPRLCREVGPIPGLLGSEPARATGPLVLALRHTERQRMLRAHLAALGAQPGERIAGLIEEVFARGDFDTRRASSLALNTLDPELAAGLRARLEREQLRSSSSLLRDWSGVQLSANVESSAAVLVATDGLDTCVLLRSEPRALPALTMFAESDAFEVGSLPHLSPDEQLEMAACVRRWGVFRPPPQEWLS